MGHQGSGSGQPTRASSAPRVSGIAAHAHHHAHTATPPGSSSVRTAASQPAGQGPNSQRMPGHHVPGSPSLNSPLAANTFSTSPAVPHHYGGGAPGGGASGASVVVFPASPATRGSSPSPQLSMVGGTMPMKSGRGTVGSTGGLQRNASPMGTMSPAGNMPLGSMGVSGNRPDLLSTTRGRSPPPGVAGNGASTVRAPRAVTPGQIVKSIQQGTGIQRNSFGGSNPMGAYPMHRGPG